MSETLRELLQILDWSDGVDLLAITLIVYGALKLIRGTRAVQVLMGLLVLVGIWWMAELLELKGLERLLQLFLIVLPFAIIVLFQQPIRRALAGLGRNPLFGLVNRETVESSFTEIVLAAEAMAAKRTGALIVIERGEGLRDYVENGIALDSVISFDLLLTIFNPSTPLHDGAVIVQDGRLAAAACFLPLTSSPGISKASGTRHRAALGISEETDALAVVVSEERGVISVCVGGEMMENLDGRALRNTLYHHLLSHDPGVNLIADGAPA